MTFGTDFTSDPKTLTLSNSKTLILSQAYHPGWVAFTLDTGSWKLETLEHVLVNNWANGWQLDPKTLTLSNSKTLYIFFWPQLLEYLGFGMLAGTTIWLFFRYTSVKNTN